MGRDGERPAYIIVHSELMGVVKWFDEYKGYGFIVQDDGESVFLHRNHADFDPQKGDRVVFDVAEDTRRKRTYAVEVRRA